MDVMQGSNLVSYETNTQKLKILLSTITTAFASTRRTGNIYLAMSIRSLARHVWPKPTLLQPVLILGAVYVICPMWASTLEYLNIILWLVIARSSCSNDTAFLDLSGLP